MPFISDISNFSRSEFTCHCGCGFATVDNDLLSVLIDLRERFLCQVIITSGCRCVEHNAHVGGAEKSYHLVGRAADIRVLNARPRLVFEYLTGKYRESLGIILYYTFVHVDSREERYRSIRTKAGFL